MNTVLHCWWQVLLAGVLYFVLGAFWYNPKTFATAWAKGHGITMDPEARKNTNIPLLFGASFVMGLLLSALVCYIGVATSGGGALMGLAHALKSGLVIGLGAFAAMSMSFIFLQKPTAVYLIDGGYHLVGCMLAALVFHFTGCC
jgi:hypothetical protein